MVTSALVVTSSPAELDATLAALAQDVRLELGMPASTRIPVVATTSGLSAAESLVEELRARSGVLSVDVVLVDFDPEEDVDAAIQLGRRAPASHPDQGGEHGPA